MLCRFNLSHNGLWQGNHGAKEADALYIKLLESSHECRTLRLNDEVALNIGPGETLVGIEILDARAEELPDLMAENVRLAASG